MKPALLGLRIALVAALASIAVALPAGADSDISISFDELVFASPGSVRNLEEVNVDPALVGRSCELRVHSQNQASVHIGNDLIVSTGSSQAVVVGVEDKENGGTEETYQMVVGPKIVVQIRIGPDGMSSLGFGLSFHCDQPPAPTQPATVGQQVVGSAQSTTLPAVTTTQPPTTVPVETAPATTTTAPPAQPEVAGAVVNGLPETPAAQAVTGAPAYTG